VLQIYEPNKNNVIAFDIGGNENFPDAAIWIDLLSPSPDEVHFIEAQLEIELPTHDEIKEIEASSRLFTENGVFYMNATVLSRADSEHPESTAIGFILAAGKLVTVRYADPLPFRSFKAILERKAYSCATGEAVFAGLVEAIVERLADILERVGAELDKLSGDVFLTTSDGRKVGNRNFQDILVRVGRSGNLTSKTRESLVSIGRIAAFVTQKPEVKGARAFRLRLKTISRDVISLGDYASFLSSKVNFLLDATLGMINIEQNTIIKIFSIAAVVFLPPTLIASMYGMNFNFMPELQWHFGYPFAIFMMVSSAILPFLYFKFKGWL
jgi:magnesium transporter